MATSDYKHIDTYLRLQKCFEKIGRIGAGAATVLSWAKRDDDARCLDDENSNGDPGHRPARAEAVVLVSDQVPGGDQ